MFALFFSYQPVLAYDHTVAHPNIANLATELYNSQNEIKITNEQINYITRGAGEEDAPIRWFNHFFDPVYNVGFSDFVFGEQFPIFPIAPVWLQSPYEQIKYSIGDRSWQRALDDYARGDKEKAFLGLGHAIHLLSDMAVPAHTRNSAHPGDSYESFVKNNWDDIRPLLQYEFKEINSLDQAFRELAEYSNNNFYSDRTIESDKYITIKSKIQSTIKSQGNLYGVFENIKTEKLLYIGRMDVDWKESSLLKENLVDPLNTNLVLIDYSKNLIPQAISYSSGLIKLFITEAEAKKAEMQYDQMSWWEKILFSLSNPELPSVRQNAEGYVMEKTIAPSVEFGGDILEKLKETKENIQELAKQNQEIQPEEFIPEASAEEENKNEAESEILITDTVATSTINSSSEEIFEEYPVFRSSPNGENNLPAFEQPVSDTFIEPPNLFLELIQNTSTSQITLTFSSTETTSLPVSFEGEINTGTVWSGLFPLISSTSFVYTTNRSGNYEFRVRAIDNVENTSTWTQIATSVPMINREYNYLSGDQIEDEVVLTKEGSPYILDYYYVPSGKTLIMEAGTIIKSSSFEDYDTVLAYSNLDVAGKLEIRGEEGNKVIFTSVYDHSFGDDFLDTLSLSTSSEQVMGGILLRFYDTTAVLKNFEMRQFDRLQPHIQLASAGTMYKKYLDPTNECLEAENSNIEISGAILRGCGGAAAALFRNSSASINDSEIISDLNAYDTGISLEGGDLVLNKVKISGYQEYPLHIRYSGTWQAEGLVLENNRVNGIYNESLRGELILKKGEVPLVLNHSIIEVLTPFVVEPGAEFYYEGLDGISSNKNLSLSGTSEDRIKIYLPDIYERAMSFNNAVNVFKYVDFVGLEPYLNTGLKYSYGVESPWGLALSDLYRGQILNSGKRRSQGLIVRNGSLVLENVRFFNSFIPWANALNLSNSVASLKNVSFITVKPYGEIFYLDETESKGINGDGGTVELDEVNFADLFCGIFSDPGNYYGLIKTVNVNLSESNFDNVTYDFLPEDLIVFSLPEEAVTSTSDGEDVLAE
ncbi:MAG TPA: hypothetical protein P5230_01210 [Candidatus Magasanikbacteria bacterium]|nr:hypothetical protein [Candidatus Magasanikbacteria bacterium]